MQDAEYLNLSNGYTYIFPEAGGNAAHSVYDMVSHIIPPERMLAVDTNPSALKCWKARGCKTSTSSGVGKEEGCITMPCVENIGNIGKYAFSPNALIRMATVHNKRSCHKAVELCTGLFLVPRRVDFNTVERRVNQSGDKDTKYHHRQVTILTEKVDYDYQVIVDFNTFHDLYVVRKVFHMRQGADSLVELCNEMTPEITTAQAAARVIAEHLQITGVGHIQFLYTVEGSTLWFVEAAMRVSGSSHIWLQCGANLITGKNNSHNYPNKTFQLIPYIQEI